MSREQPIAETLVIAAQSRPGENRIEVFRGFLVLKGCEPHQRSGRGDYDCRPPYSPSL